MELGAFSVSLSVKNLAKSRAFYEALGFEVVAGDPEHGYQVLRNGVALIGLFQGMFDGNILTFNPGWSQEAAELDSFDDVREIQSRLEAAGLDLSERADPDSDGRAHIMLTDPDGNAILIDQHVSRRT